MTFFLSHTFTIRFESMGNYAFTFFLVYLGTLKVPTSNPSRNITAARESYDQGIGYWSVSAATPCWLCGGISFLVLISEIRWCQKHTKEKWTRNRQTMTSAYKCHVVSCGLARTHGCSKEHTLFRTTPSHRIRIGRSLLGPVLRITSPCLLIQTCLPWLYPADYADLPVEGCWITRGCLVYISASEDESFPTLSPKYLTLSSRMQRDIFCIFLFLEGLRYLVHVRMASLSPQISASQAWITMISGFIVQKKCRPRSQLPLTQVANRLSIARCIWGWDALWATPRYSWLRP